MRALIVIVFIMAACHITATDLEGVIDDAHASPKTRYLVAEQLYQRDPLWVGRHDASVVARIYGAALQRNLAPHMNAWGMVWYTGSLGASGAHVVGLGAAAVPILRELLRDRTVLQGYIGSEEAVIGNGAGFRVRDFAAYYLSRILNKPLGLHEEPPMSRDYATRDAAIDKL